MKSFLLSVAIFLISGYMGIAQEKNCATFEYQLQEIKRDPTLQNRFRDAESFSNKIVNQDQSIITYGQNPGVIPLIRIPVVIHILYKNLDENISIDQVLSQLDILNKEFRMVHADTSKIPIPFRSIAADCHIEFALATINPQGYATNGILRKRTNAYSFGMDDKIKFSNSGGDDAWDSDKYLNIWVANLSRGIIGYSSVLGGPKERDGIAIAYTAFGNSGRVINPYSKGRTAVHEVGHWLGLRHIWGDQFCGDDGINDTPPQGTSTRGCPSGTIISCNNAPTGNMYNNYMDLTNDECTNMFTMGQRDKMRAAFQEGGPRYFLLSSNGSTGIPLPEPPTEEPLPSKMIWVYPNPATSFVIVDISKSEGLLGKMITIHNQLGELVFQTKMINATSSINLQSFKDGIYILKVGPQSRPYKLLKMSGRNNP